MIILNPWLIRESKSSGQIVFFDSKYTEWIYIDKSLIFNYFDGVEVDFSKLGQIHIEEDAFIAKEGSWLIERVVKIFLKHDEALADTDTKKDKASAKPEAEKNVESVRPKTKRAASKPNILDNDIDEHEQEQELEDDSSKRLLNTVFNWSKIYNANDVSAVETVSTAKNRNLQNLINRSLETNSRTLFYSRAPLSRSVDYGVLKFFDNDETYKFITGEIKYLRLSKPEVPKFDKDSFPIELEQFSTKTDLAAYIKGNIDHRDFLDKLETTIDKRFNAISKLVREAEAYLKETGNWSLHVSWPFIEGLQSESPIRTPLMWMPVQIQKHGNVYTISKTENLFLINTALIIDAYKASRVFPQDLKIAFETMEDLFREYERHGIRFQNQLAELKALTPITKEEYRKTILGINNHYQLVNNFVLENKVSNDEIFQDLSRVYRDFGDINLPAKNRDLWGKVELPKPAGEFEVDQYKAQAVEAAKEDSTVIWGPPGTGKSEAITMLLAKVAAEGQTALLVAQKETALGVVLNRLDRRFGMKDLVLKLNGNALSRENKTAFYEGLSLTLKTLASVNDNELQKILIKDFVSETAKNYSEIAKILTDSDSTGKSFSELVSEFWEIDAFINRICDSYKQRISYVSFWSDLQKLLRATQELESLKALEQDQKREAERLSQSLTEYESESASFSTRISEIVKPPLAYIPKATVTSKYINSFVDDKDLFRALSNKQHNLFSFGAAFKAHRLEILELRTIVKEESDFLDKNKARNTQEADRFLLLQDKINTESARIIELAQFVQGANVADLTRVSDKARQYSEIRIKAVTRAYLAFEKEFGVTTTEHAIYQTARQKLKQLFQDIAAQKKKQLILSIRSKIEDDAALRKGFKDLVYVVNNSTRKPTPSTLFKNNFRLFQAIFPIMIATPKEVSIYLPYDKHIFDYGIFDEASQMFLQNALPTIHRCKKITIAGDDKQLGPALPFQSVYDEVDEDLELANAEFESESLLAWGKSSFREVLLEKHYRSTHHKLIEYSNLTYYGGNLKAYSTPTASRTPISCKNVNGAWIDKTNHAEAQEAVNLFKKFAGGAEQPSVGIITFNFQQKSLIEDMIEQDREARAIFAINEQNFVKNIENVQGDEADYVIFSIAYAPREDGQLILGPLSHITPNRLNVAITRSKIRMYVLKSFNTALLSRSNVGSGRRELYSWLKWAEETASGTEEIAEHTNFFRSVFEEDFYQLLKSLLPSNIEALSNYKINGYELDIVLRHTATGNAIGAIELDGWTYHQDWAQIAQDLDKTSFLESLGWKIIRVGSKSFYREQKPTVQNVLKILEIS